MEMLCSAIKIHNEKRWLDLSLFQFLARAKLIQVYHYSDVDKASWHLRPLGPRLNIKTVLSTYGDFHVKDKTAVRTSYL